MKIHDSIVNNTFIENVNLLIDNTPYLERLVFFDSDNLELYKYIKNELSKNMLFSNIIKNSHIVIRCVKASDKEIARYPHFDNYSDTYVIPLKIPTEKPFGELHYLEKVRPNPTNIYSCTFSKFLFQNFVSKWLILNFFYKSFKVLNLDLGDVAHFNGLTTLHYNNPVSTERRSILIHTNNPFIHSPISRLIERLGMSNVKKSLK